MRVRRFAGVEGQVRPPSDKSLTHRAYMLGALANGQSRVRSPLESEDAHATRSILTALGARFEQVSSNEVVVHPCAEWHQPDGPLDCGNSGTTMRLMAGLLAARPLDCTLTGDASLSRRPMKRVAEPLRLMGAQIDGDTAPLRIRGGHLHGIDYATPVASAQIKSAILLAGLLAEGVTRVTEPAQSRDHTERMLTAMGAILICEGLTTTVQPGAQLKPFEFEVPADISSAAFLMVAAALAPGSHLELLDVSINPTRTGILSVLREAGVLVAQDRTREVLGEPVADLLIQGQELIRPFTIAGDLVPTLIDEIPVLAVLATQAEGVSHIRDAAELRVKESDRIDKLAEGLRAMGAEIETHPDGMIISGPTPLRGVTIDAAGDHRLAMAFAVAGLVAEGETVIEGAESVATSYPDFERDLWRICLA
ncbi:MAG: 3-phosphoshikimate 1-carboxyvinyltransferase [Methanoregulaceae archaeon]|nr:3-phosphoshikimate 1-carboxyvinyltransferase [Methanoregulaceae archaeon]